MFTGKLDKTTENSPVIPMYIGLGFRNLLKRQKCGSKNFVSRQELTIRQNEGKQQTTINDLPSFVLFFSFEDLKANHKKSFFQLP